MASTSTTSTLRLRMSPVQYRRSRIHASISEAGPSRLPSFSQILDLDMKDLPLSDDQFSFNEQNTPKITTTTAPTRSDNPAAVLRALLSRLPAHPPSPTKSSTEHERESDFDTGSESNASPLDNSDDRLQRTEGLFSTPPTSLRRQNAAPLDNSDDRLQRTEELSSTPPPSLRRQKSPKSFKIRVLDAFGREQDPDESVEDAVRAASPSHSTVNRGELLSRIRTGLDDLVVGIDDLDK